MRKIFVAGHNGMVGSAICRRLLKEQNISILVKTRQELDLLDYPAVCDFMRLECPDEVILAAAKVGGIYANNNYPAEFIFENLQIQNNIIHASHLYNVQKLLFLGSSCIYPKLLNQPIKENALLTSVLESTNEPYAIAKIAGIKLCESYNRQYNRDYRSIMPTNLYGPGDNYHPENSHVVASLIGKFHNAKLKKKKEVIVWGTGKPMREFMHVDDMADASLFVHNLDNEVYLKKTAPMLSHVNIGTGKDITILELANVIRDIIGFQGKIIFDNKMPDGTPRKLLDVSLLKDLGWSYNISLKSGLQSTYVHYIKNVLPSNIN